MVSRFGGAGTVVLTALTATCGLFLVAGVGPSGATDLALPTVTPIETGQSSPTTVPVNDDTVSTPVSVPVPTPVPTSDATTTTTTTTTTTAATTTTVAIMTTTTVPTSVSASNTVVGLGGTVTFDGTCPTGTDRPLVVWIIAAETTDVIDTGITSGSWSYTWTAPTDERNAGSFTFQFWCGDPAGFAGGYPASLQQHVDMVASEAPPKTTARTESEPPVAVIPATS